MCISASVVFADGFIYVWKEGGEGTFQIYIFKTRNTLDCDQSNYSSRTVFSHIPIEFGQTGISAIRSAATENPVLEPNTE